MPKNVEYILSLRDLFIKKLKDADKATEHFDNTVKKAQVSVKGLVGEVSAYVGIAKLGYDFFDTAQKVDGFNSSLKFTEGSTAAAAYRFDYLVDKSNELGLNLESAAKGYSQIAAAAKGTVLEGKATRDAFEGVSMAASVMHLSGEQAEGALLALSQIISKGKVQAEELRGQLGERIPGAFQIAARAMNMTTKELDAFMADGKLLAEDFIPRFSQQLIKEFGGNIPEATESLAVANNNLRTEYFLLMKDLYEEVKPAVIGVVIAFRELLTIGRGVILWLKDHSGAVKATAFFIGALATGVLLYNGYVATTVFLTKAWATAQAILNGTLALNPIGLTITAVAALAAGIYYLWETSEGFRATMYGIYGVLEEVIPVMYSWAKAMVSVWVDPLNAVKNFRTALEDFKKMDIKLAFEAGYGRGKISMDKRRTSGKEGSRYVSPDETASVGIVPGGNSATTSTSEGKSKGSKVTGSRPTTINISIDSLIKEFNIETKNIQESTARIKEVVVRTLLETVNDSQRLAGN